MVSDKFKSGDKVKLIGYESNICGSCEYFAQSLGIDTETILTVKNSKHSVGYEMLTFEPPYHKFGKMLASRFEKVD